MLALLVEGNDLPRALSRARLNERCGFTSLSGTVTRVMRGLPGGTSSGAAMKGLIELGMVDVVQVDVDGVEEQCYRVTQLGRKVMGCYAGKLPPLRSREVSTNNRYKKLETPLDSDSSDIYNQPREPVYVV